MVELWKHGNQTSPTATTMWSDAEDEGRVERSNSFTPVGTSFFLSWRRSTRTSGIRSSEVNGDRSGYYSAEPTGIVWVIVNGSEIFELAEVIWDSNCAF